MKKVLSELLRTALGFLGIAFAVSGAFALLIMLLYALDNPHLTQTQLFLEFWPWDLLMPLLIWVGVVLCRWADNQPEKGGAE